MEVAETRLAGVMNPCVRLMGEGGKEGRGESKKGMEGGRGRNEEMREGGVDEEREGGRGREMNTYWPPSGRFRPMILSCGLSSPV